MINIKSCNFTEEQIKKIEEAKNAKYVCDTQIYCNSCYPNVPVSIFYGDVHPVSGSRYFGIYYDTIDGEMYITDGSSVDGQEITGQQADNGEIIFSRFRHDFRTSSDGSVNIDGGREYTKITGKHNIVPLVIKNGELIVE